MKMDMVMVMGLEMGMGMETDYRLVHILLKVLRNENKNDSYEFHMSYLSYVTLQIT
jgi:hypothetical protein